MYKFTLAHLLYNPFLKTRKGIALQIALVVSSFLAFATTPTFSGRYALIGLGAGTLTVAAVVRRANSGDGIGERTLTWLAFTLYLLGDFWLSLRYWAEIHALQWYSLWAPPLAIGFLALVVGPVLLPRAALRWFEDASSRTRQRRTAILVLMPVALALLILCWTQGTLNPDHIGALAGAVYEYSLAALCGAAITWDFVVYQYAYPNTNASRHRRS
jgi:hypothetical protein